MKNLIMGSVKKTEGGSYLALEPDTIQKMVNATTDKVNQMRRVVQIPIVLTSPIVRVYFKKLVNQFCPDIVVLSFNEIDPSVQIQALGNISLS